jgi:hypothetical protein
MIAKEKSALIRRELQGIVVLTSKLTTQLGMVLTSKDDLLFSSFGIITHSRHQKKEHSTKITVALGVFSMPLDFHSSVSGIAQSPAP